MNTVFYLFDSANERIACCSMRAPFSFEQQDSNGRLPASERASENVSVERVSIAATDRRCTIKSAAAAVVDAADSHAPTDRAQGGAGLSRAQAAAQDPNKIITTGKVTSNDKRSSLLLSS